MAISNRRNDWGLIGGCVSPPLKVLSPVQVAMDIKQIIGAWEGYGGDGVRYTMTMASDGTYRAVGVDREFTGQLRVSDGECRFKLETSGRSGTFNRYEDDGRPILETRWDDGSITGQYATVDIRCSLRSLSRDQGWATCGLPCRSCLTQHVRDLLLGERRALHRARPLMS